MLMQWKNLGEKIQNNTLTSASSITYVLYGLAGRLTTPDVKSISIYFIEFN